MRIQYLSDLHIEMMTIKQFKFICDKIVPQCETLILAGDIGNPPLVTQNYQRFLDIMSKKFDKIFLVTGNHEYYGNSISKTDEHITEICKTRKNISFLNNSTELYKGFRFVGATQWTKIHDPRYLINDFTCINDMNVRRYNDMHDESKNFLKTAINDAALNNEKCVVITHHLPLNELVLEKYKEPDMLKYNQCFSADMRDVFENKNSTIKSWFYGHTHTKSTQNIFGIKFLCNPIGYNGENKLNEYNITIDVDEK